MSEFGMKKINIVYDKFGLTLVWLAPWRVAVVQDPKMVEKYKKTNLVVKN